LSMLDKLLGSKTREKLLRLYLAEPGARYYIREIERKLGLSVSALRREVDNLFQMGFLQEVPPEELLGLGRDEQEEKEILKQKRKYFVINPDFIFYPELKALFAKNRFLSRDALVKKLRQLGRIDLLVLSGSFAGADDAKVDILIVGEMDRFALSKLIESFEKELNTPIYWALFSREEYENRKAMTDKFLFEVLQGKKIELINKIDFPDSPDENEDDSAECGAADKLAEKRSADAETENEGAEAESAGARKLAGEGDFVVRVIADEHVIEDENVGGDGGAIEV